MNPGLRRGLILLAAAAVLGLLAIATSGCTFSPEGPSITVPDRPADLDPYGYDGRDTTTIGKLSVHGAAELRFTWRFTWPWDHPETWQRPDMPNYPTEHLYPWND